MLYHRLLTALGDGSNFEGLPFHFYFIALYVDDVDLVKYFAFA